MVGVQIQTAQGCWLTTLSTLVKCTSLPRNCNELRSIPLHLSWQSIPEGLQNVEAPKSYRLCSIEQAGMPQYLAPATACDKRASLYVWPSYATRLLVN